MIQRIQNLYLFCIVIALAIFLIMNCRISKGDGFIDFQKSRYLITVQETSLKAAHISEKANTPLMSCLVICGLLSLGSIFLFKNLKLQKTLVSINFLLIILNFLLIFLTHYQVVKTFYPIETNQFFPGLLLPFSTIIFNFLAYRGIRKDIDLLASADRLR